MAAQYTLGIDLGTTNSVVAYVKLGVSLFSSIR
jgi:molecular chaperone DnaK (HSP70)